jgi:hypothetical protein
MNGIPFVGVAARGILLFHGLPCWISLFKQQRSTNHLPLVSGAGRYSYGQIWKPEASLILSTAQRFTIFVYAWMNTNIFACRFPA